MVQCSRSGDAPYYFYISTNYYYFNLGVRAGVRNEVNPITIIASWLNVLPNLKLDTLLTRLFGEVREYEGPEALVQDFLQLRTHDLGRGGGGVLWLLLLLLLLLLLFLLLFMFSLINRIISFVLLLQYFYFRGKKCVRYPTYPQSLDWFCSQHARPLPPSLYREIYGTCSWLKSASDGPFWWRWRRRQSVACEGVDWDNIYLPPLTPLYGVMGCGAAEATGLGFVCFVVINPRVLSQQSWFWALSVS